MKRQENVKNVHFILVKRRVVLARKRTVAVEEGVTRAGLETTINMWKFLDLNGGSRSREGRALITGVLPNPSGRQETVLDRTRKTLKRRYV